MTKKLLTKLCALMLLALVLSAWSSNARADVTINVKATSAPHIYAWDSNQNAVSAAWPGDEITQTTVVNGVSYYTITFANQSSINLLFHNNNGGQTKDFTQITGNAYFNYDGATKAYGTLPDVIAYNSSGKTAYFVNASTNWENVYAYAFKSSGGEMLQWPGTAISAVATDGAKKNVYQFGPITDTSYDKIIFTNNSGKQTANLDFNNGVYYVYGESDNGTNSNTDLVATINASRITNSSAYFADENLRQAITDKLGVAEGKAFTPSDITVLDISNHEVSNVSGIHLFSNLEELYASNNNITTFGYSPQQSTLRVLDLSGNSGLKTTMTSYSASSFTQGSGRIYILGFSNLEELILDNCDFGANDGGIGIGSSSSALPRLRVLRAKNNPNLNSMSTLKNGAHLEYIDLSNCGLTRDALNASNFGTTGGLNLKYLDVSNNPNLYNLSLSGKTNLEVLKMNNCTAYDWGTLESSPNLKHIEFSGCTGMIASMWDHLNGTNHPQLQYLNLSNGTTAVSGHPINFPALDTLVVTNHNTITELNITGHCPAHIDVTNSTPSSSQLRVMAITNCGISTMPSDITGLTSNPKLYRFDLTGNQFTSVPTIACPSLTTMVMNNNLLSDIDAPSNVRYLYARNNNFPAGEYVLETTLHGVDLGNNRFTKFKAVGNANLKSIALANSPSLTEIELHENPLLTQTSPDGEIETDNGLYIKGLSSLQTLNIENSSFSKLGQQNSLEGVTGLTKLQARKNKFTTFTNGVYALDASGSANYRIPAPTESSLEHLTALEYLDLAYNNLQDSVHLYKNVNLKHLDVSHNNEIHGVIDGTIDINDAAAVTAMKERKGRHLMKYGKVGGKTYGVNATPSQWTAHYTNLQATRERPFDLRVCDLNDTTGIYHLDLSKNVNLEWLDISYTNIHNTAAGPTYMCPGWMDKDWVTDIDALNAVNSSNSTSHRAYVSWHTFVYFIPCSKLKVIHADHNNMRSLGIRYFPELDTLTSSYMYGDSEIMRDFPTKWASGDLRYNMGNTALSTTIKKFHKVDWENLDDDGNPAIVLWGPNRTEASSDVYPNKLRYWDVSYSGFNEIRLYPGTASPDLPYLEYVNVSGNPLNFQVRHYNSSGALVDNSTVSNYNSLDVTYCPNIRTVLAENCADLPVVRAHNRTALDTLNLSNDANLKTLYVQNDPLLKANFQGLSTLTGLETLFGYNNTHWGNDITFAKNTALKNLWISNIDASSINVANNAALEKLRAYDNSLTSIDLSNNGELLWLDVARNKLPSIDLSGNTKLQFFNISNGVDNRTQLDGTEQLNHDGSDGDAIKPATVYSDSETPIESAEDGNSLSDLALPASIVDARANGNDLHAITGYSTSLTNIEFAHNHINGIDLSAAPNATVDSRDNGRTITADFASFKVTENNVVKDYKVYFFQLDPNVTGNGTVLTDKQSRDIKDHDRVLGVDGLVMNKITWDGTTGCLLENEASGGRLMSTTITPNDGMNVLNPNDVPGTIVVLTPTTENGDAAKGKAVYSYDNGTGTPSEFYLNWSSDGTITGINMIDVAEGGVNIENSRGDLVVSGTDGTVVGVYDLNGRQVASETISGGSVTIEGLSPGIYIVNGNKVLVK